MAVKKIFLIFFVLLISFVFSVSAWSYTRKSKCCSTTSDAFEDVGLNDSVYGPLSKKDVFQAELWIKTARGAWLTGDYSMAQHFSEKIVNTYPGTQYSNEASQLLTEIESPKKNKKREFRRNNPGLTFGNP